MAAHRITSFSLRIRRAGGSEWVCVAGTRISKTAGTSRMRLCAEPQVAPDRPHAEGGFTLLELMITVAVIAILAAVVIPSWMGDSRKTKGDSEINAMFAELANKEEQYKIDNGVYLGAATCPSAPSRAGVNFNTVCVTTGSAWATLRVNAPESTIRCTYVLT